MSRNFFEQHHFVKLIYHFDQLMRQLDLDSHLFDLRQLLPHYLHLLLHLLQYLAQYQILVKFLFLIISYLSCLYFDYCIIIIVNVQQIQKENNFFYQKLLNLYLIFLEALYNIKSNLTICNSLENQFILKLYN